MQGQLRVQQSITHCEQSGVTIQSVGIVGIFNASVILPFEAIYPSRHIKNGILLFNMSHRCTILLTKTKSIPRLALIDFIVYSAKNDN